MKSCISVRVQALPIFAMKRVWCRSAQLSSGTFELFELWQPAACTDKCTQVCIATRRMLRNPLDHVLHQS